MKKNIEKKKLKKKFRESMGRFETATFRSPGKSFCTEPKNNLKFLDDL